MSFIGKTWKLAALGLLGLGLLGMGIGAALGQSKQNALTQINWVPVTGSGAPTSTSCGGTCTSAFYGLPYTDLTNHLNYVYTGTGAVSGWTLNGGGSGTPTGPAGGDLTGTYPNPTLAAKTTAACPNIGGTIVCYNAAGQVLSTGAPYAITSFSCTAQGTFEIGYASTNPNTCTLAYANGTTASASLSDGTHTTTLTTPFTSGNLAFAYTSNTTFSASATATNSQTDGASVGIAFQYCSFSGVGNSGASGATASGSGNCSSGETSTMTTSGAVLASNGLYGGGAQSFSLSPSGQYIILFLPGGCGRTITVNTFTTAFVTHSVSSYTNLLGGVQSGMCSYTSPTNLTGTYAVVVN